ncbi:MAG: geranylgeranyl reductase family protein [Chitinivibrionales bacterium]|nr:geranylgeranyl reductase family protein [Chitinivibrionales bacterium]
MRRHAGGGATMNTGDMYDIVVVGAGPAGATTARHAAEHGLRVLILERSTHVGSPVRCGEAAGADELRRCVDVEPDWIAATTATARMVSPSGIHVDIDDISQGYILRRDLVDRRLVEMAVERGAEYRDGAAVVTVQRDSGNFTCVDHADRRYRGRCLVLADGVESRLARQIGWDTTLPLHDMCSCAFARVRHESVAPTRFEMHYGSTAAPGGYAWVFPRGDNVANVGLGILGARCAAGRPLDYLHRFVEHRFGRVDMTDTHCAGVPVAPWVNPLARDGAMLVGDAARQVDALTGGGIIHAMDAGRMAADAAAKAFAGGTFAPRALNAYTREWARGPGKQLSRTYALKRMVVKLDDAFLDSVARRLNRRKAGRLGLAAVCISAFASRPLLLLKALAVYR